MHARTHAHTHTHSRLTALCPGLPGWAGTRRNIHPLTPGLVSDIIYQLPPSTMIHSMFLVQFICLIALFHNLSSRPLWSSSGSGTLYFILHTFLHPIIIFFLQHIPIPSQPVAVVPVLCHIFLISLSAPYLKICLLP